MKSSKIALLALFPLLTPATLFAQADERTTIWESLREADVRLAESSRTLGFNQAFLNHRVLVEGGVLAEECGAVLSAFFKARREQR